jgi:hypothetical protein
MYGGESRVCSLRTCFSQQILDTLSAQPQLPTTRPRPEATAAAAAVVVVSEVMYLLSTAVVAAVAAKVHVLDTAVVAVVVGI